MVDVARRSATYAEYLAIANDAEIKYEYIDGEIVAMAGGTIAHARLIAQTSALLNRSLDGQPCIVMPSDMRVRIEAVNRATYPDLFVVCGTLEPAADDDHALINPTVIVEVMSDRTHKFAAYRRLSSLREYALVAQDARRIEIYRRDGRRWVFEESGPGERARLESINAELSVDDIYTDRLGPIRPDGGSRGSS
jgi:Uma2 family endonuclease